jgi:hypothetical protein
MKAKLFMCKSIFTGVLACGLATTASFAGSADPVDPSGVVENKICVQAPTGIWYVVEATNETSGESVKVPVFKTKYLSANAGDAIFVKAVLGKEIGYFVVGDAAGQIPLGGGLQCTGSVLTPKCDIIPSC